MTDQEKITPIAVFTDMDREQEIHAIGDYVSVCFGIEKRSVRKTIEHDGAQIPMVVTIPVRTGNPFIDFVSWYGSEATGYYTDDDSPVEGGLGVGDAKQIVYELARAVAYITQEGW